MRELTTEQTESVKEHLFNKLGVCLYDIKNKRLVILFPSKNPQKKHWIKQGYKEISHTRARVLMSKQGM